MPGEILKRLAVAAGTGLPTGPAGKGPGHTDPESPSVDNTSDLKLLLERLDGIEARMSAMEIRLSETGGSVAVSRRLSTLETTLVGQSATVKTLSQRLIESEENMQRLVSAVERLCERRDARPGAPAKTYREPPVVDPRSERQPEPPAPVPDSGFRPRIIKEDDNKVRHRKPLTRL
jgi:uncharacterized coiled-coil protein SlyX